MALSKSDLKLSICIATFNRSFELGTTLEKLAEQMTPDCEVVVSDNASSDDTEQVVSEYSRRFNGIRYVRQRTNVGVDRNFDRAVEYARGEYCWLMPDDDVLKPGAIRRILDAVKLNYSVIFANAEAKNHNMEKTLLASCLDGSTDSVHGAADLEGLFMRCHLLMQYIGSVIIRRSIWLERCREKYYNCWYIHIGVIFQEPLPSESLVIAQPCISIRVGTQSWLPRQFLVDVVSLPSVVWSLPVSNGAKSKVCKRIPWRSLQSILFSRAVGGYTLREFRKYIGPITNLRDCAIPLFVAVLPQTVANVALTIYIKVFKHEDADDPLYLEYLSQTRSKILRGIIST